MDSVEKKRKTIIGLALAVTLIAVVLVEDEEAIVVDTAQPVSVKKASRKQTTRAHAPAARSDYLDVDQLGQRTFDPLAGKLFASMSWVPKRPQATPQEQKVMAQQRAEAKAMAQAQAKARAEKVARTPPPLQFTYIGKAIDGNKTWVFLAQDDENFIAKIGEKIDGQYRLDTINDESVTLTYLPLNAKQTLPIQSE